MTDPARPEHISQPLERLARRCPTCGAGPGQLCTTALGQPMPKLTHPSRAPRARGTRRRPR